MPTLPARHGAAVQVLFEQEQILPDGRSRIRNVALSEKLVGDEPWQEAVSRAIQEELGTILPSEYEVSAGAGTPGGAHHPFARWRAGVWAGFWRRRLKVEWRQSAA